jgi:cytochrome c-type biogenesis protein
MADVSFAAAFGAGLMSFVSPCALPLAAPYLCYLGGASVEALVDESEAKARHDVLLTAFLFVAGFSTVFVGPS